VDLLFQRRAKWRCHFRVTANLAVKGFMSGAFRYAVRTGVVHFNPMRETMLPKSGKPMESRRAYTLAEIQAMLKVLDEPERTIVLVAALTGLRMSEIRGLRWEDYDGETIHVRRSVWKKFVGETKTNEYKENHRKNHTWLPPSSKCTFASILIPKHNNARPITANRISTQCCSRSQCIIQSG
jgi:integrase